MILLPEIKDPVIKLGAAQVSLTGATTSYESDKHDFIARRSVINGHMSVASRGEYFEGSIDAYNLSKAQYITMKGLVGLTVRLWPFGTGTAQDNPLKYYPYVDVVILTAVPYHRNNAMYMDAIIITFASVDHYTVELAIDTGITQDPGT